VTGRFMAVDRAQRSMKPKVPQSWNRYAYAIGNPLKYVDPDGEAVMISGETPEERQRQRERVQMMADLAVPGPAAMGVGGAAARGGVGLLGRLIRRIPGLSRLSGAAKPAAKPLANTAARTVNAAYETAVVGGRHAGTLRNYAGRSLSEIQSGVAGYERQVALHAEKLANPAQAVENWGQLAAQEQAGLLAKWYKDLVRNQELADVLRGLAASME